MKFRVNVNLNIANYLTECLDLEWNFIEIVESKYPFHYKTTQVKQPFDFSILVLLQTERHFIMQVVCETTQSTDVKVKVAALQCLVRIMSLYYQYMETYMGPALFAITLEAMKSDMDEVALQGMFSRKCQLDNFISASILNIVKKPSKTMLTLQLDNYGVVFRG